MPSIGSEWFNFGHSGGVQITNGVVVHHETGLVVSASDQVKHPIGQPISCDCHHSPHRDTARRSAAHLFRFKTMPWWRRWWHIVAEH